MLTYMYVYVFAWSYAFLIIHIGMHVIKCVFMYMDICIAVVLHSWIRLITCIYVYMCSCMYVLMYICIYAIMFSMHFFGGGMQRDRRTTHRQTTASSRAEHSKQQSRIQDPSKNAIRLSRITAILSDAADIELGPFPKQGAARVG